jgi:hypothetical protein
MRLINQGLYESTYREWLRKLESLFFLLPRDVAVFTKNLRVTNIYKANHIRLISEFILYATKNTNDADHLIPFIM